jgi:hypothetical protein
MERKKDVNHLKTNQNFNKTGKGKENAGPNSISKNQEMPVQKKNQESELLFNNQILQLQQVLGNQAVCQLLGGDKIIEKKENKTGMSDSLKKGVEKLSGEDMSDVKVHYNSPKPKELNAHAYTKGTDIYVGPGQEKHLPHEAWHVVQQKKGKVSATTQLKGEMINDSPILEKEADIMGKKAHDRGVSSTNKMETPDVHSLVQKKENTIVQRKEDDEIIQDFFDNPKTIWGKTIEDLRPLLTGADWTESKYQGTSTAYEFIWRSGSIKKSIVINYGGGRHTHSMGKEVFDKPYYYKIEWKPDYKIKVIDPSIYPSEERDREKNTTFIECSMT